MLLTFDSSIAAVGVHTGYREPRYGAQWRAQAPRRSSPSRRSSPIVEISSVHKAKRGRALQLEMRGTRARRFHEAATAVA